MIRNPHGIANASEGINCPKLRRAITICADYPLQASGSTEKLDVSPLTYRQVPVCPPNSGEHRPNVSSGAPACRDGQLDLRSPLWYRTLSDDDAAPD